jgi:hypothetical protein
MRSISYLLTDLPAIADRLPAMFRGVYGVSRSAEQPWTILPDVR